MPLALLGMASGSIWTRTLAAPRPQMTFAPSANPSGGLTVTLRTPTGASVCASSTSGTR
eukprot:CAMPEP_0198215658 /NCGR_PEP_ID=MMETSP1445-20131203/51635_1 /TAXON_ID=36898 /ORGANISM="Pyramimonas sp., Strain CCMP2087" /LENGTH=58 /DNA_ID=CAMNT_0043891483 /DNA_START=26 /DNA_END=199 /DNA_ORIENTATION=-